MIILRNKLFSSDSDEKKKRKKDEERSKKIAAAGAITVLGGGKVANYLHDKARDSAVRGMNRTTSDSQEINAKLKARARGMRIKLVDDPEFKNSAYLGTPLARKLRKIAKTPEQIEQLGRSNHLGKASAGDIGTDSIAMGLGNGDPATLAHEMGHASMSQSGRSHDIIGKAAHSSVGQLSGIPSNLGRTNLGKAVYLGAGIRHGVKAAKKEEEGDKKGAKKELRKGLIRSSLLAAPELVAEAAATRKGMKYLREAGASKETMRNARKTLGGAWGTYASTAAKPVLLDVGGTAIGYGVHKLRSKSKKKNNKKDKNED